jgi:ppGpp synthetase/RelA/SpoT-type nucleotidyltranferase
LLFDSEETYNNYKQALLSTYRARVSVFTNQLEVAIKENDLAISLVTDKVTNTNDGLWVCTETKGLIEEGKTLQILQGETLQENNKVKEKLIGKVWKEYDKALQGFIILQSVQDIARLQIKKNLWRLVVKLLLNKSLLIAEEDYSSFASLEESFEKSFIEEVIQQEILSIKYTLLTGYVKESNFLKWRANYFLKVLAPLSKRLNLSIQLEEVEQLALKVLYPVQFKEITDFLDNLFCDKENFAINVKLELEKRLKESEIQAEVTYRIKTPYSIYRKKTERKRATLEKILDFVGFRIITENVDDCYRVLTVVENMGSRFEGRGILAEALRDYIKSPKLETGYQSIHINIEIPANVDIYGEPNSHVVEFQIRTQAMHAVANRGESSHSYYKDALRYSRPTLTKDFKVSQKSFRLLVECEKSLISEVGKTIRSMHFDILSVDIEGTTNGRILLRLELRIRKQKDSLSQESSTVSSLVLALESLTFTQNEEN